MLHFVYAAIFSNQILQNKPAVILLLVQDLQILKRKIDCKNMLGALIVHIIKLGECVKPWCTKTNILKYFFQDNQIKLIVSIEAVWMHQLTVFVFFWGKGLLFGVMMNMKIQAIKVTFLHYCIFCQITMMILKLLH